MSRASFIRSLLARGEVICAISILLLCATGCHNSKDTDLSKTKQPTTTEVSASCTTSTTASTTTSPTTSSTTTGATTTVATMTTTVTATTSVPESTVLIETEIVEAEQEPEEIIPTEEVFVEEVPSTLPLSEQDYILIANVVSHEAGSSWISTYERAQIVAAIMNRVADSRFPDTVDGVVHQPGQMFDVPYERIDYSGIGYEPIDEAIALYFSSPSDYDSINCWCGNGTNNYFYTI